MKSWPSRLGGLLLGATGGCVAGFVLVAIVSWIALDGARNAEDGLEWVYMAVYLLWPGCVLAGAILGLRGSERLAPVWARASRLVSAPRGPKSSESDVDAGSGAPPNRGP